MQAGSTVAVTATILPAEVRSLQEPHRAKDLHLTETLVSGGNWSAGNGPLTIMAAVEPSVLE